VLKISSIKAVCRSIAGRLLSKRRPAVPLPQARFVLYKQATLLQATGYLSENKYRNKDLEIQIPSAAGGSMLFPT
jgi:hypothetical protein